MSSIFDATNIFWPFVKTFVSGNVQEIIYNPEFTHLSYTLEACNYIALNKSEVWIDEKDIDILDYPNNRNPYFDSSNGFYIFENLKTMFFALDQIYTQISNIVKVDETRLNRIISYQNRQKIIRRVIEEMSRKNDIMTLDNVFSRMKI